MSGKIMDKWNRELLTEFLEMYRCLPCLWDNDDKFYGNKEARDTAYSLLLEKYKKIDDTANVDSVKKKIENMRTSYKRELRKIMATGRSPGLWYYHLMTFLEKNKSLDVSYLDVDNSYNSGGDDEDSILRTMLANKTEDVDLEDYKPSKKKVKTEIDYVIDPFDDKCTEKDESIYLQPDDTNVVNEEDEREIFNEKIIDNEPESFGKTVGFQLKELNQMQRTIAEKLISEVIFYGRLDKLSLDSKLCLY